VKWPRNTPACQNRTLVLRSALQIASFFKPKSVLKMNAFNYTKNAPEELIAYEVVSIQKIKNIIFCVGEKRTRFGNWVEMASFLPKYSVVKLP
jgi:hypothetical protein